MGFRRGRVFFGRGMGGDLEVMGVSRVERGWIGFSSKEKSV